MNSLTRRAFIKRSGTASLGSAIGLGLIPSVTSKLKAVDTSGGIQGVVYQLTSKAGSANAAPVAFAGGTLDAGVSMTSAAAAGTCNAQIIVKWRRWFSYSRDGATIFTEQQLWQTTWICSSGVATYETQHLNEDGSPPAPGATPTAMTLDSRQIIDASGTNCGLLEALAMPGTGPAANGIKAAATNGIQPISTILNTGLVSHSISCCTLVAA